MIPSKTVQLKKPREKSSERCFVFRAECRKKCNEMGTRTRKEKNRFQKVSISSPEWAPEGIEASKRSWDGQLDARIVVLG